MVHFEVRWFYHTSINLDRLICNLRVEIERRGAQDAMTEAEAKEAADVIESLIVYCERLCLIRTGEKLDDILMHVKTAPGHLFARLGRVQSMILELRTALARDLAEYVFLSLSASEIKYYQQEQLFGPEVFTSFPSTNMDVAEAGNCYATGRYTACVFHCMRVVEKGLHALVHDLNNRFAASVVFNRDIEYVNWGNIIDKLESEIRSLLRPSRQPRLAPDDLQFYSQTSTEFVYFKNAWRDDVSHSRSSYDENEAKTVMNHVEAFMRKLAVRLSE